MFGLGGEVGGGLHKQAYRLEQTGGGGGARDVVGGLVERGGLDKTSKLV
jgi:hypothetical protein